MPYYEAGRYWAKIIKQGFGTSQNKGTPYFYFAFRPLERIVEEIDGEAITEPINNEYDRDLQLFLTQKTIAFQLDSLRGLGWGGRSFSEIDPTFDGHHSFVGQEIKVVCEHKANGDKVYENWSLHMMVQEREHKAPAGLTRTLDEEFNDLLLETATATQPRPAPSDEVPF